MLTHLTTTSVTRIGEISPFWLKLLIFFGNFSKALFNIRQYFEPILAKNAIGHSLIVVYGQILKNNLPIWSLFEAIFELEKLILEM